MIVREGGDKKKKRRWRKIKDSRKDLKKKVYPYRATSKAADC